MVIKFRKLFPMLAALVALTLLSVTAFVANTLRQNELRYTMNAQETSKNLALSLEHFLHSHFQEVDLTLRRAQREFLSMHAQQRFNDADFSAYLRSLKERIPQARSIRGADRDGRVIYGEDIDPAHVQDLTIREFFQRAKQERDLIFGIPVKSRITGEWVFPLVYGMTLPDGSFGGAAYVNMNNSRVADLFSSLNIGPHGVITLIDSRRLILIRYPEIQNAASVAPLKLSPETAALFAAGKQHASYSAVSTIDARRRVYSLEKIGDYPVYVLVGLSEQDFLAPWRDEVRNAAIFLTLLFVLAGMLLWGARASIRKQYQFTLQLITKDSALLHSLAALEISEARMRTLTEGLPQMVWTATPALRVDYLSHHWQDYAGVAQDALRAAGGWSDLVHPDDRAMLTAQWDQAQGGHGPFRCACRLRRHDGVWRVFDHHALPQYSGSGAIVCWVGSSTDISEEREAHAALLTAKEQALKADRAKSTFLANMSHEIRSPMNAVLGMIQLLRLTQLSVRQLDYASKAESAARALLDILNDILDFSKVEAGEMTLDPHPFSLDGLLRDMAVIFSANLGDKHIEVLFHIDPALPDRVVGDALRLKQILLNLAGNAIKFTERGEVVLSVQLIDASPAGLSIAFAIRDTGIGITPEQCQRIFDGFSQAELSTARHFGGTGLGLSISERLVQLMGGTLCVDSVPGQGSTFHFLITCQAAPALPAQAPLPVPTLNGLHCLMVDDNATARLVMVEMANAFGWTADEVDCGMAALVALAQRGAARPYDVVFLDRRMPGMDGWETGKQIRQLLPAETMPLIVMVTAFGHELSDKELAQHGAVFDAVLDKPMTASMMLDAVADAKFGRAQLVAPASDAAPRRLMGLRLLLVEDNPTNQQVARELLKNDGAFVQVADGGRAAIDAVLRPGLPFDVILMDIQMPGMDGYAATRAIRATLGQAAPPIIAMTANAMSTDREAARAAGMVDHVGKPFNLSHLIDVILRHAQGGEHRAPAISASPDAAREPALNSVAALGRFGGNTRIYLFALRGFVDEAAKLAGQLQAALLARQRETAMPLLHTLKGLAGTVGADHLAGLLLQAEMRCADHVNGATCWDEVSAVLAAIPHSVSAVRQLADQLDAAVLAPLGARTDQN